MNTLIFFTSFVVISLASYLIGKMFSRFNLPYITGYLFAGALAGPFLLGFLPTEAVEALRFVDELSLAVIAFVAGSELNLPELRKRLKPILLNTAGISISALLLGGIAIYGLTAFIPFTQDMGTTNQVVVAILGATVLLALSPPSTIAVIKEVRAQGPFTRTVLSVTVFMDVVIIVLFAVATSVASAMITGAGLNIAFIGLLALDLSLALFIGYIAGNLLKGALSTHLPKVVKTALVLLIGFGIYELAAQTKAISAANLPFEIYIEPLLIALIGGFMMTNFSPHRDEFEEILHDIGPAVYVAFFTLTGVSLKLDILLQTLPFAAALFGVRVLGIAIGSYAGATLSKEPPQFRRLYWLSYVTQAGIALGLAREVAVQFPALGNAFATLIISVIVLNEIFGPMFLKSALKRAGEAHLPGQAEPDQVRDVVIFGIEEQSLELARQLQQHNWRVVMADPDKSHVERLAAEDVDERHIPDLTLETVQSLVKSSTDAVVMLMENDKDNLSVCEMVYEEFGIQRLIVRLRDLAYAPKFRELGAIVVDPTSAMVNLLDQSVRAPQSAALVMHQDSGREIVQITVNNPDVEGLFVRDLRLPNDVLFLDITRNGQSVLPSGYTALHVNDEVTLVGMPDSLDEVTLKLGY